MKFPVTLFSHIHLQQFFSRNQAFHDHFIHMIFLVIPDFCWERNHHEMAFLLYFSIYFYCHCTLEGKHSKETKHSRIISVQTINKGEFALPFR